MPDINPAELSRPSVSLSTPILSTKSITVSAPSLQKVPKTSQIIPQRIDLEPIYAALKAAIGNEQWAIYKEATTQFFIGRLNQAEFSEQIDPILASQNGEKEHLHNQLIAALYANVTREMPDQGLAPWVSANDKPTSGVGNKPVTGDATERRLKGDVMQLPNRDRRRLKDLAHNDFDPYDSLANVFSEHHKIKAARTSDVPASAAGGGINRMNWDLEIRKRFAQPLAIESGEFPDTNNIEARMLPFCYEAGLVSGHTQDAAALLSVATENFIKEVLSTIFSRTRSNGPGDSGSAGLSGPGWIRTHKYNQQLTKEEDGALRGEIQRDKSGLLPSEAKAASERGPIGMADLHIALDMGDCGMSHFPIISRAAVYNYREGELENWEDYTFADGREVPLKTAQEIGPNGAAVKSLTNGLDHVDHMDIDNEFWWEGAEPQDGENLDSVLDSCLAIG